jgi:hypothetical protein
MLHTRVRGGPGYAARKKCRFYTIYDVVILDVF